MKKLDIFVIAGSVAIGAAYLILHDQPPTPHRLPPWNGKPAFVSMQGTCAVSSISHPWLHFRSSGYIKTAAEFDTLRKAAIDFTDLQCVPQDVRVTVKVLPRNAFPGADKSDYTGPGYRSDHEPTGFSQMLSRLISRPAPKTIKPIPTDGKHLKITGACGDGEIMQIWAQWSVDGYIHGARARSAERIAYLRDLVQHDVARRCKGGTVTATWERSAYGAAGIAAGLFAGMPSPGNPLLKPAPGWVPGKS